MAYQISYDKHHELTNVLVPFLQESSEPRLSLPEATMGASALIDLLAPTICKLIDEAVIDEGKRIALATGRG